MPTIQAEQHCINESTTVTEVIEEPKTVNTHTLNHSGTQSTCRRRFCEVYGHTFTYAFRAYTVCDARVMKIECAMCVKGRAVLRAHSGIDGQDETIKTSH